MGIYKFAICDICLEDAYFVIVYETIETGNGYIIEKKSVCQPHILKIFFFY